MEAASLHPAKCIGIQNKKGTLNYDSDADMILLSDDLKVLSTWIAGECVYEREDNETQKYTTEFDKNY